MRRTAADKSLVKLNALPLGSGTNFFTDSTAKPGVEYFYAIQTVAIADKEGSISAEYPFSSSLGEAPVPSFQQLIATDKVVELSWSIVSSNVKEINVYRASVGASNAQKIATLQPGTSEYTDSAVELGKGYFYYLTTTGLKGDESERSEVKFVKGLNK